MKKIKVRTNDLWFTDDPFRSNVTLDFIRENKGTEQLPPIIICECAFQYKGIKRNYAIIDGNRRAFVDGENRQESNAELVEDDNDLEQILSKLPRDHGLVKTNATRLSRVVAGYMKDLPRHYDSGRLRLYQ
jgi:hypothetical protein